MGSKNSSLMIIRSALYTLVLENLDQFAGHLENFVEESLNAGSFSPPIAKHDPQRLSGYELFFALATILFECVLPFLMSNWSLRFMRQVLVAFPQRSSHLP